jgi:hypothetical protein
MKTLRSFLVVLAFALPVFGQQPPSSQSAGAEVLVLGVYHMANPGHDIFNTKADDVLAPKRQAEIAELIAVLKKFNPTKIAVEADVQQDITAKRYADYLAGKHELTRNEIEQIGFRLAKEMGHKNVYGVDADGEFPWPHLVNYAKASGRSQELDGLMAEIGAMVKAENDYLAAHTVLETLVYMNADERVAQDVGFYFREAHFGEPGDWAGADLVADWYRRNIRIYSNVTRLVDSPNQRVLVIFGAGHLGWLRQDVANDPTMKLRKLQEFVK